MLTLAQGIPLAQPWIRKSPTLRFTPAHCAQLAPQPRLPEVSPARRRREGEAVESERRRGRFGGPGFQQRPFRRHVRRAPSALHSPSWAAASRIGLPPRRGFLPPSSPPRPCRLSPLRGGNGEQTGEGGGMTRGQRLICGGIRRVCFDVTLWDFYTEAGKFF